MTKNDATMIKKAALQGCGLLLIVGAYLWVRREWGIGIGCVFNKITHWYCPGCGTTRMLLAALRGDFQLAFSYNPLMFVLLPVMAILWLEGIVARAQRRKSLADRIPAVGWAILMGLVILYGVLRNLPGFEFLGADAMMRYYTSESQAL